MEDRKEQNKARKLLASPFHFTGKPYMRGILLLDSFAFILLFILALVIDFGIYLTMPLLLFIQNYIFFLKEYKNEKKTLLLNVIFTLYNLTLSTLIFLLLTIQTLPFLVLSALFIAFELTYQNIKHKRGKHRKPNSHFNRDGSKKIEYSTREDALNASHKHQSQFNKEMRPYKCSKGNHYHIGSVKR